MLVSIMVSGDLKQYVFERFDGEAIYKSILPSIRLGGLEASKAFIPIDLVLPSEIEISKALLELAIRSQREKFTWRLKVNGVPVTREFKPNSIAEIKNYLFSKIVYDVTPIMKAKKKRRNRCNIVVKYEGSDHLIIEHIGLLLYISSEDAKSHISLLSGALALEPGETYRSLLKHPVGLNTIGTLRITLFLPSTQAETNIRFNGRFKTTISSIVGGEEAVLEISDVNEVNTVEIEHVETDATYYPKELLISSLYLQQSIYREPKLAIKEIILPENLSSDNKIKMVISNEGEAIPDKSILTIIHFGTTIYREELPNLEPGEETVVETPIKLPKGRHPLIIRLIWKKLSRTTFTDKKIILHMP